MNLKKANKLLAPYKIIDIFEIHDANGKWGNDFEDCPLTTDVDITISLPLKKDIAEVLFNKVKREIINWDAVIQDINQYEGVALLEISHDSFIVLGLSCDSGVAYFDEHLDLRDCHVDFKDIRGYITKGGKHYKERAKVIDFSRN